MQRVILRALVCRLTEAWCASARAGLLRRDARRGNAAIEAALLFPITIIMLFGLIDASNALIVYRRVTAAAEQTALIATELSVQQDGSTSLTTTQLYLAGTAIFALMPGLAGKGSSQPFSVTVSAIRFDGVSGTGVPSGCLPAACTSYTQYTADLAWSVPLCTFSSCTNTAVSPYLGSQAYRGPTGPTKGCGTLTQVAASATPTLTTVPTSTMTALTSVLVVDVSYTFTPLFTKVFVGPVTFWRSAFLPPRLGNATQYVEYDIQTNNGVVTTTNAYVCTNFL